ncbi:2-hydroxyacid dehydrogenase [Colwelliaceae bacterium 6471]
MSLPIPFISQLNSEEKQAWLANLKAALPEENFVLFEQITEVDKKHCQLAIVANPEPKELLAFSQLVWVQSVWAGVERLVSEVGEQPFDIVRLVDPVLSQTMAEAVLAWTLYLHRDMPNYRLQQMNRCWQQRPYVPASKRKVGILGLGELGRGSAIRLADNGFDVMGWSKSKKEMDDISTFCGDEGLTKMISQCHLLVCLLPLTDATLKVIDEKVLLTLPKGASLINFSRGSIIDTSALVTLLDNGHIGHAVLDVFEQEPLAPDSLLWAHPNITILPHISAPTNIESACQIVANNIRQYRKFGKISTVVDKIKGY